MVFRRYIVIALLIAFVTLLVLISTGLLYLQSKSKYEQYQPWETESILSTIGENTPYDILIMGSSHGRLFSRNRNHILVEDILERDVATIAGGSACVVPAEIFLDVFYAKQNTVDTILYFVDPWCFYSDKYNTAYIFEHEPFDLQLLITMIRYKVDSKIIKDYLSRTLRRGIKPYVNQDVQPRTEKLTSVDENVLNHRLLDLYEGNIARNTNSVYVDTFLRIDRMLEKQNSEINYIIPPTLYNDPHHADLISLLDRNNLTYIDMSKSVTDPKYYYDHDHLNVEGVKIFLELLKKEMIMKSVKP